MMRILITGVAGFIGSNLAIGLLERGDKVIGIDDLNDYYSVALKQDRLARLVQKGGGRFQFHQVDFSDDAALTVSLAGLEFDRIVHLGAQAGVRYSIENPSIYVRTNVVGHLNLLELARVRQVEHFVYASSSSVYGGNEKLPFSEDDRVDQPLSLYAATKKSDELISESYANLFRIPQTGLRFFTVYGPWGRPDMMMWIFTSKILAGDTIWLFNSGNMYRDFTYVGDIVAGVISCLDNPPRDDGLVKAGGSSKPHTVYNIGNSQSEHLLKVVELLERECGRKARTKLLPMQQGDVGRTYADIAAIQSNLGYRPMTSIEDGVPAFVSWYKGYHGF